MTLKRCMLAANVDFAIQRYPVLASPKLDGIRCCIVGGRALTRTLKEVPNRHVFNLLSKPEYEGLDGELVVGSPTSKSCYRDTSSGVMSRDGEPDFMFYVFDKWNRTGSWTDIMKEPAPKSPHIFYLNHELLFAREDVYAYEETMVERGYEGIILRDPVGPYKFGRSTVNEGLLLKVKRFEDSEAVIIGMEEEMFNGNELTTDARGYAKRTSHQENKVGKGRMGALLVRDIHTGVESRVGTGFDAGERDKFWQQQDLFWGQVIKYKYFAVGVKDKPRHPVFLGFREDGA